MSAPDEATTLRACRVSDQRLFAFVDGDDDGLDEHVAGCEDCQLFLAELWSGELQRDLREPVLRQIRLEEFLLSVMRLGLDIAGAYGKAAMTYLGGTEVSDGTDVDHGSLGPEGAS